MDALLLSLILCAMVEADGASARLYVRVPAGSAGLAVLFPIVCFIAAVSALAGASLAPMLTPEARHIFLAAALAIAGGSLFFVRSAGKEEKPETWSLGSTTHLLIAGLSDSAPLLIAGIAVAFADPWLAGIGGALGWTSGCIIGREALPRMRPAARLAAFGVGALLLGTAFILAMQALRLV